MAGAEAALRILVEGRVQGVFFRAYTRDRARELGLSGWVRNLVDGRVEVFAQGDRPSLLALLEWCGRGSPMARVDRVSHEWVEVEPGQEGFRIAPTGWA